LLIAALLVSAALCAAAEVTLKGEVVT